MTLKKEPFNNNRKIKMTQVCRSIVLVIEYWTLRFICNLVLVIWNFKI